MRQMRMALLAMGLMAEHDPAVAKARESAIWSMLPSHRRNPVSQRGRNRGTGAGLSRALEREAAKAEAVAAQYAHLPPASA